MRPGATPRTATSLHGEVALRTPRDLGAGGGVTLRAAPVTVTVTVKVKVKVKVMVSSVQRT